MRSAADPLTEDDPDGLFQFGIDMSLRGLEALAPKRGGLSYRPTGARPNQRSRRLAPKAAFSATSASDGAWNVPTGFGPVRKSTSTRPTWL
jgi:hypothetical protein